MDLSIQMKTVNGVKHRHVICVKLGNIFLTYLTKLALQAKASIWSTNRATILSNCRNFLAFAKVII